jgi:hypothetical protein
VKWDKLAYRIHPEIALRFKSRGVKAVLAQLLPERFKRWLALFRLGPYCGVSVRAVKDDAAISGVLNVHCIDRICCLPSKTIIVLFSGQVKNYLDNFFICKKCMNINIMMMLIMARLKHILT